MAELLRDLRAAGARLLVLSDVPDVRALGDGIALPDVPEWLSPLVAIIPAQLFATHLALARGLEPEAPRHLTKVTLTPDPPVRHCSRRRPWHGARHGRRRPRRHRAADRRRQTPRRSDVDASRPHRHPARVRTLRRPAR
jgi:hypothetical protein